MLAVTTPFAFADGDPIGFYLVESMDGGVSISDNADTLAHFASIGVDISDRKKWRTIRQSVEQFGLRLLDSGEIVGELPAQNERTLFSNYVGAMMAVSGWEREYLGEGEELQELLDEVEFYLRAWRPREELQRDPTAIGHSRRPWTFHFQLGDQLIDAARPHGNRTGAILRKAADLRNAGEPRPIMVIMDDREDAERARVETDILTALVGVMPMTTLIAKSDSHYRPQ